jgi:hemolysin activation/secretion protein
MNFSSSALRRCPLALSALTLALCATGTAVLAQTAPAPNAGQVLRDLQQAPVLTAPQAAPLQRSETTTDAGKKDEVKALVTSVSITGNQELPSAELQPLVADLVGKQQSLTDLNAAARRITAYYRARGYAVARAYLPAQNITSGAVTITVIEGRIASYNVKNQSRLSDERANGYFSRLKSGDVIKSAQVDRSLLLVQDTPGVGGSRATLQPGASVGTSELLVEVDAANAWSGNAAVDNYGSRYTGEYRLSGNFNLASPLKIGDQLSFTGLTSGDKLSFARLAYQLPVGSNGLRVGAAYFDTRYTLGKEFAALGAHGSARSGSVYAAYPFIRSQLVNLSGTAAYEDKRLHDDVDSTATATAKKVGVTSLGLAGNLQDALGGGGINNFDLSVAMGKLRIESPGALAIDAASAQSNGSYTRISYALSRLQSLTDAMQLAVSVNGQQASKNLDSSEKFSLGGVNGVRAYPQSEATGDEGYKATIELRRTLTANVQGTVFYDYGSVKINKNPFGPAASNNRSLGGVGFGVNANVKTVQLRASMAWRTQGGAPTSVPASADHRPTVWLQASVAF